MNDKITNWILAGRLPKDLNEAERKAYGVFTYRDNKPIDDLDAIVLLPVLSEKNYGPSLTAFQEGWHCKIGGLIVPTKCSATISEAITTTVLMLIERGKR